MRSNLSFNADALRRTLASLSPLQVAGYLHVRPHGMRFTRGEKKLLLAACLLACALGGLAGYVAYSLEAERQFHGGILEEDAAGAAWNLRWLFVVAFIQAGVATLFAVGVIPLLLRRFFSEGSGSEV